MKSPKDVKISMFPSLKNPKLNSEIPLFKELKNIKDGTYKNIILKCRKEYKNGNKELYTNLKNTLPSVTFCGVFKNGRKLENLVEYNNLMVIDIDKLDIAKIIDYKQKLSKDEYFLALWISPSGYGLKGLIKIESNKDIHKTTFSSLSKYFMEKYDIEIDKSGNDITRLCFTSLDKDIYYNANSKTYINQTIEKKEKSLVNKNSHEKVNFKIKSTEINKREDLNQIDDIIKFLDQKKLSITSDYSNWVNVGLAISHSFSYEIGKELFLRLCRLDNDKHNEIKSINLIESFYRKATEHSGQKITIKSIVFLATKTGYKKNLKRFL